MFCRIELFIDLVLRNVREGSELVMLLFYGGYFGICGWVVLDLMYECIRR